MSHLNLSQSPTRHCQTPQQWNLSYSRQKCYSQYQKPQQSISKQANKSPNATYLSSEISQAAQPRLLKTEIYQDRLVFQGGRIVHSRNEGIPNSIILKKEKGRAQQPQQQFHSQSQQHKKVRSQSLAQQNQAKSYFDSFSLNNTLSKRKNLQNKNSINTWTDSHQLTVEIGPQKFNSETKSSGPSLKNQQLIQKCYNLIESQNFQEVTPIFDYLEQQNLPLAELTDVFYLKGLVFMTEKKYQLAINSFNKIVSLKENSNLIGQVSLMLSLGYKKLGQKENAIQTLSELVKKKQVTNQFYYDGLIERGKLYLKSKELQKAYCDFKAACLLEWEKEKQNGLLGLGDVLRLGGKVQEALMMYSNMSVKIEVALMRKAIGYMEMGSFVAAQSCIDEYLALQPQSSEGLYLKGVIQNKQGNQSESLLCYEQAIKQNNSKKAVSKCLLEITKMKIDERDFYGAFYSLQRSEHLDVQKEQLVKLQLFTEGVVFLMKRKYQEGIENLTQLISNYQLGDFLRSQVFHYRAYGFICVSKYQKALNDLNYISNVQVLERSSEYNKLICSGIIMAEQNQFEKSIEFFHSASKLHPGKMEPYFYRSMALMKFVESAVKQEDMKKKYVKNALKQLDFAVTLNDSNSNLLYHRGLLRLYFNLYDEAILDLNKAIEKSEENNAKFYYVRGLVQSRLSNYKQSLSDFTISINLDSKQPNVYLNRAKAFQMLGDRNTAFNDLQKYISMKPSDPDIHLWAGNLLFSIGAYENAIKAYSHSADITNNVKVLNFRAQCFIIIKELNSALSDFERIIELSNDQIVAADKDTLISLKTASSENPGSLGQANKTLNSLIKTNLEGNVFKTSDLLFYRGVNKFYMKKYNKALQLWDQAVLLKQQQIKSSIIDSDSESKIDNQSSVSKNEIEDLSFEDRTFTIYEHYYNQSLALIMMHQYDSAVEKLGQLKQILQEEPEYTKNIEKLLSFIESETKGKKIKYLEKSKVLVMFPSHNRLCCIFPLIQLPFKQFQIEARLSFCLPRIKAPEIAINFDFKLLEGLSVITKINLNMIAKPTIVENKPEAPWIKRNQDGVVFTDNIQIAQDLDLKSETQRSDANEKKRRRVSNIMKQSFRNIISLNEDNIILTSQNDLDDRKEQIEKLKQQLQLSSKVQAKLAGLKNL